MKNLPIENNKQQLGKKIQILYAWNYLNWGGAQIHFLAIIKEVKKKFDVRIILPVGTDEQLIKFIEDAEIPIDYFAPPFVTPKSKGLLSKFNLHLQKLKSEYAMLKTLEKADLDKSIVHIELSPWYSLFSLIWLALRTNVFITMHNSLPEVPKWRFLLWKVKLGIISHFKTFIPFASNKDSRTYFKQLYSDRKYREIEVTYTSVDPLEINEALRVEINRNELCARYNLPTEKTLIFCIGQFIDRKGRWIFLEAAKNLKAKEKDVAFVWISNSKPNIEDIEKAEQFGLREDFIIINSDQVGENHLDLFKLLRLADIFALVSYQEGLPISLLEAMALGIPSISTNVNAVPEAVKHLETGWLIEAGDSSALTEAFQTLKNDPKLRKRLAENGSKFVLKNFNDYAVGKIVLEIYEKAIK